MAELGITSNDWNRIRQLIGKFVNARDSREDLEMLVLEAITKALATNKSYDDLDSLLAGDKAPIVKEGSFVYIVARNTLARYARDTRRDLLYHQSDALEESDLSPKQPGARGISGSHYIESLSQVSDVIQSNIRRGESTLAGVPDDYDGVRQLLGDAAGMSCIRCLGLTEGRVVRMLVLDGRSRSDVMRELQIAHSTLSGLLRSGLQKIKDCWAGVNVLGSCLGVATCALHSGIS